MQSITIRKSSLLLLDLKTNDAAMLSETDVGLCY